MDFAQARAIGLAVARQREAEPSRDENTALDREANGDGVKATPEPMSDPRLTSLLSASDPRRQAHDAAVAAQLKANEAETAARVEALARQAPAPRTALAAAIVLLTSSAYVTGAV